MLNCTESLNDIFTQYYNVFELSLVPPSLHLAEPCPLSNGRCKIVIVMVLLLIYANFISAWYLFYTMEDWHHWQAGIRPRDGQTTF